MPTTLRLLRKEITYSEARREEVDILRRLQYYDQQQEFFVGLAAQTELIKAIVTHHLGLFSTAQCQVAGVEEWLHGSYNVCIPVSIRDWNVRAQSGTRVLLRLPLPYRLGEDFRPGNADEKIRCEAGTYAWLQGNCPDIPIPRLYGFAASDGVTLTHISNLSLPSRFFQNVRRLFLSKLGCPLPSSYIAHPTHYLSHKYGDFPTGYMLIEFVEATTGRMLSSTWATRCHDPKYRRTLFRDLSRILLSLTRISLPVVGSFVIDNDGYLKLTNRPLTMEIQALENDHIPTDMPRDFTYSTVDSYIVDLLRMHNNRLRYQQNAINNISDYLNQTGALTTIQATFPSVFSRDLCRGPFAFTLTDLHASNIFVDDDWHITSLVDLEWGCSRPIEMIRTPTWLTNKACDEIAEDPDEYGTLRSEFTGIMANEERSLGINSEKQGRTEINLSTTMNRGWQTGTFWFSLALASPTGLFTVFYKQIQPRFIKHFRDHDSETFWEIVPWYWSVDCVQVGMAKLQDEKDYDTRLKAAFGFDESG